MRIALLILSLTFIFTSCVPYARLVLGIKKIKVESSQKLYQKVVKKTSSTEEVVHLTMKPLHFDDKEGNPLFPNYLTFFSRITSGAALFNAKGQRLDYLGELESGQLCLGKVENVVPILPKNADNYPAFDTLDLKSIWPHFRHLDTKNNPNFPKLEEYDYIVLLPWVEYWKQTQRDMKKHLAEFAARKDLKIKFYTVNCDIQKDWKVSEKSLKSMRKIKMDISKE